MNPNGNPNNVPLGTEQIQPSIAVAPPVSAVDQQQVVNERVAQAAAALGLPPQVLQSNHPVRQRAEQAARAHYAQQVQSNRGQSFRQPQPPPPPPPTPDPVAFVTVAQDEDLSLKIASIDSPDIRGYVLVVQNQIGALSLAFVPMPVP